MEFTEQDEAIGLIYQCLRLEGTITKNEAIKLLSEAGIPKIKAKMTVEIWEGRKSV